MALVRIKPSCGPGYLVKQSLALQSGKLKTLIEELGTGTPAAGVHPEVSLPRIRAKILCQVLNWMYHHRKTDDGIPVNPNEQDGRGDAEVGQWDRDFVANLEPGTLMELVLAADFLEITELVNLTANATSALINGKTPAEIRKTFKIKKDLEPEQEELIRRENAWCEQH